MSPVARICSGCSSALVYGGGGRCDTCTVKYLARRRGRAGNAIWSSGRWKRAREEARERDGQACVQCGSTRKLAVHHIHAIEDGGAPYDLDNLVTLCASCHAKETHRARRARESGRRGGGVP